MLDTIAKTAVVSSLISMFNRAAGKKEASDYMAAVGLVIAGAAIGAGAALLFAPKPGVELRSDVRDRVRKLTANAGEKVARMKEVVGENSALEQH